jgi:hypothetical protein
VANTRNHAGPVSPDSSSHLRLASWHSRTEVEGNDTTVCERRSSNGAFNALVLQCTRHKSHILTLIAPARSCGGVEKPCVSV